MVSAPTTQHRQDSPDAPITPVVIRNLEPMDLPEFLARYAGAIVEARGTGTRPALTLVSTEAA